MSMIFPGMDPYLEAALIWPSVHSRLVVYIADQLQPKLGTRYIADVGERVYVEGPDRDIIPDVSVRTVRVERNAETVALADADAPEVIQVPPLEIHESYVAILDRQSQKHVVAVIEVVSPTNKYAGPGQDSYLDKQRDVLQSQTHLVEIDLLRAGPHVLAVPERSARTRGPYDYLVCVNRSLARRDKFELYRRRLRERLPRVRIPLAGEDPDVVLDVQEVVAKVYDAGRYRERINYDAPCHPPLSAEDQSWANQLIEQARQQTTPS